MARGQYSLNNPHLLYTVTSFEQRSKQVKEPFAPPAIVGDMIDEEKGIKGHIILAWFLMIICFPGLSL